ncbi:hypothetical protein [Sphingobium sp. BS19]|uniref:hypothetical protein n=1 Tax=Sphingobium sp. BS19 TaxID=3018973 RepID=UPI00249067AA|nr:hypothetical protein [Sphingobium sp. BS19]
MPMLMPVLSTMRIKIFPSRRIAIIISHRQLLCYPRRLSADFAIMNMWGPHDGHDQGMDVARHAEQAYEHFVAQWEARPKVRGRSKSEGL